MKTYNNSCILATPSPNVFYDYAMQFKNAYVFAVRAGADNEFLDPNKFYNLDNILSDEELNLIRYNQASVENHPDWLKMLKKANNRVLFQKQSTLTQELKLKYNLNILNNELETQEYLENKVNFRKLIRQYSFCPKTQTISKENLLQKTYQEYQFNKFVIQGDCTSGGNGTYFIFSELDYNLTLDKIKEEEYREYIVTEYIKGETMAAIGINYGNETVVTSPYNQIIGNRNLVLGEISNLDINGKFMGNSIPNKHILSNKIIEYIQIIGDILNKQFNYKGIFGIDFIITENQEIKIIECNPRIMGAFPVIDMFYSNVGIPSPLSLHIKEFIGENDLDYKYIQKLYINRDSCSISQIIFFIDKNLFVDKILPQQNIKPGLYNILGDEIIKQSNSLKFENKNKNEFIVSEIPISLTKLGKRERVVRIIFSWEYNDKDHNTQKIINWIKEDFILQE